MTEIFIRSYLRASPNGSRYEGDADMGDVEEVSVAAAVHRYWTKDSSWTKLLVISNKPLGDKRHTFKMRNR